MDNYDKNEKMKSINSTKSSSNINIEDDLNDLIKYGRWELSLISSLKSEKNYKKNLLVINKDWLSNWKEITGYNFIKNKIFQYLVVTQKNKNDTKKIEEETKKLNELWLNIKLKNNINISNIKNIPKIDNKKYLLHVNNKILINSREKFDVISNNIFDLFQKYLDKNETIKVGGLFSKKKLLLPFNYNDKNVDYIFINMFFIINNKNELGDILFEFPKLKLDIIEKIRKEISNKNINEFIKDINESGINNKEYIFKDENNNQYIYKVLFKKDKNQIKQINKKSINIKQPMNEIKINKEKDTTNNYSISQINDIFNFDINNLTSEQIEQKIKEIEEETLKQIELENNLKEEEILLMKKSQNLNAIDEYNKYEEQIEELQFKIHDTLNDIQVYKEKENNLDEQCKNINLRLNKNEQKIKNLNEYQEKEHIINMKLEEINKKEIELKNKENNLIKKEKEVEKEKNNNKEKRNELKNKEIEINKKEIILKKQEDLENERINKELEEEYKELEKEVISEEKNTGEMGIVNEEGEDNNSFGSDVNNDNDNDEKNYKFKDIKSQQIKTPSSKLNKLNSNNINEPKFQRFNSNNDNINSINPKKELRTSFPNSNLKNKLSNSQNSFENEEKIIIDKNAISLGLNKINPTNLNSIIQCFVHLKDITEGILSLEKENFFENNKKYVLTKGYLELIKNLFFQDDLDMYSLDDFLELMKNKDKKNIFQKNKLYIDSNDLINFLIEELHKELNTKKMFSNMKLSKINYTKFESSNEKEALCKCLEEFTKNNNSIISKNFYGVLKNKITCHGCKIETYNFELYTFLNFNIAKIKNFIMKEEKQDKQKDKTILKLSDCFDYFNKPEYLVGDSGLYCKNCKSKNATTIIKSIYSSHPIIPIIIDRENNSKLNKDKLDFPEEIDLSKYIEYKHCSKHFYLCGVVTNFGYSNNFGKFEAFCRMEKDGKWYNFSDEKVSKSNWEDIHNSGMQYILFYHKV